MERILSHDERIRRAEEIYLRRQNLREKTKRARLNVSSEKPKNFKLLKRLILQIVICMLIYFIFYLVNTTDYSFSKGTLDKTEELISKDVDFVSIYNNVVDSIKGYLSSLNIDINEENKINEENNVNNLEENANSEDTNNENTSNQIGQQEESTLQGELIAENGDEKPEQTDLENQNLSETDVIKQKYSFVNPVSR